jgi:hypothetical protein
LKFKTLKTANNESIFMKRRFLFTCTAALTSGTTIAATAVDTSIDLATYLKPFTADAIANGFATLIGALLGAMLAYIFQRILLKKQEQKAALMSAHRTMFALLHQINTIVLIQRDYVFSHLDNPGRFISIPATAPFDTNKDVLDMTTLSFLIDTRTGRLVLYEFYMAQQNYVEALNHWNLRSVLHQQQIQPALASSNLKNGAIVNLEEIEKVLGTLRYGTILNATNDCIVCLSRAFEKLAESKTKVRKYAVERFKTNDFTDFDFPETYGLTLKSPN